MNLDDLLARYEPATRTVNIEGFAEFKLRALPGAVFDDLRSKHPPSAEQWEKFRETQKGNPFATPPEFDSASFAPALIGSAIAEVDGEPVEWGEDEGQKLWAVLHDGARADLLDAAWGVNGQRSNRPLSETATGTTRSSGSGSTTPQKKGSRSRSSKAG